MSSLLLTDLKPPDRLQETWPALGPCWPHSLLRDITSCSPLPISFAFFSTGDTAWAALVRSERDILTVSLPWAALPPDLFPVLRITWLKLRALGPASMKEGSLDVDTEPSAVPWGLAGVVLVRWRSGVGL